MIQLLPSPNGRHSWKVHILLTMCSLASALIAISIGMSLFWLGLIPGRAFLVGSAWMGILACYLFPFRQRNQGKTAFQKMQFGSNMVLMMSGLLLFIATGSYIAANNTKEQLSQRGYTTFTASGAAHGAPQFLKKYESAYKVNYNTQPKLQHQAEVAVHLFRMYNEDLPKDLVLFLILTGGITAACLSVLIALLASQVDYTGFFLGGSAAAVLSQGIWAGAAVLAILIIQKLTR
ncbi:MAG: hypothetical protein AAFV95_21600 [Bacteroidota bacterium]